MKTKNFLEKSKNIRKKLRQNLKNKIVKAYFDYGRLFTTNHYVTPDSSWLDISFLSKDKTKIYSCAISNAVVAIEEKAGQLAHNEADQIVPYNPQLEDPTFKHYVENGKSYYKMQFKNQKYPEFDNNTRSEWISKRTEELTNEVSIYEKTELKTNYRFIIGLHATLNTECLDTDRINSFIIDFIRNGEKEYFGKDSIDLNAALKPASLPPKPENISDYQFYKQLESTATQPVPGDILKILGLNNAKYSLQQQYIQANEEIDFGLDKVFDFKSIF